MLTKSFRMLQSRAFTYTTLRLLVLCTLGTPLISFSQIYFADVATALEVHHSYGESVPSGGISFCDFNGDGWDDLTLATKAGNPIAFFQNNNGSFQAIDALTPDETFQGQILWVDYDNDGDKDLFMTSINARNRLYRNEGNLHLVDVTTQAGLTGEQFMTYGACFGDYDRDGWLDLYLSKRTGVSSENTNLLYKNRADGTFVEVALMAGASDSAKIPFCSAFIDYNNDLWPDLYTANDRSTGNTLLRNNQDGTFTDISLSSRTNIKMNGMSVTVGDYNRDGLSDIYVTNTEVGNVLLRNEGNDQFIEVAAEAGVAFYAIGWGALFLDADNNGWQDLYVSGAKEGSGLTSSAFYYNSQDGSFTQPDVGFAGDTVRSYSNAIGDYNRDGKADIMVINGKPYSSQLWSNQTQTENGWISIQLEGVLSNRDAIGSNIVVYVEGIAQKHFTQCGTGFLGQNSHRILFGLGNKNEADSITIEWPTGHIDRLYAIPSESELQIVEGSSTGGEIKVSPAVQLVSNTGSSVRSSPAFSLYPNPAHEHLLLSMTGQTPSDIHSILVLNVAGQVQQLNHVDRGQTHSLDLSHLTPGVYWLQVITTAGQYWQQKFIKH